jgi:hypothetical protein
MWTGNRVARDAQRGKSLQNEKSVRLAGLRVEAEGLLLGLPIGDTSKSIST